MWIPSWITLPWTPYTFIPPEITPLLTVQSIFKLNSGYLHIPIHAQGEPLAFRGLLLVKVFSFLIDAVFSDSLMTRTAIAPRVRPRKGAPRVAFQTLDLARSTSIHQLLPGTGILVRRRHSVLSGFVSRCPYQKSNWSCALIASEPNTRACRWRYWRDHPRRYVPRPNGVMHHLISRSWHRVIHRYHRGESGLREIRL